MRLQQNPSPFAATQGLSHPKTLARRNPPQTLFGHAYVVRSAVGNEEAQAQVARKIRDALKEKDIRLFPDIIPIFSRSIENLIGQIQQLQAVHDAASAAAAKKLGPMFDSLMIFTGKEAYNRSRLVSKLVGHATLEPEPESYGEEPLYPENLEAEEQAELEYAIYQEIDSLDAFDKHLMKSPKTTLITVEADGQLTLSGNPHNPFADLFVPSKRWLD